MAYSSDIARLLADQLARFVTLQRHQLIGQVANLDFWEAEVRHCLDVIDGYSVRFERMKNAQKRHVSAHGTVEFRLDEPGLWSQASPPSRVPDFEFKDARRNLSDAAYRFLVRCVNEELIDVARFREICARLDLGVEVSDLRQRS